MATHYAKTFTSGGFKVMCAAGRKNSEGARWVTGKEFDAMDESSKCKHCIKARAEVIKAHHEKKAAEARREADQVK